MVVDSQLKVLRLRFQETPKTKSPPTEVGGRIDTEQFMVPQ
jgi:hypothetical protein